MNHAIKVLEHEKTMLEKILKPYYYNISKGFNVPRMDKHENKLKEINNALELIKINA